MAQHLNLEDQELLPSLLAANNRWDELTELAHRLVMPDNQRAARILGSENHRAAGVWREAMGLLRWLTIDEWLCSTGRLRTHEPSARNQISMRKECIERIARSLEFRPSQVEGLNTSQVEGLNMTKITNIAAQVDELLKLLHAIFGPGDAVNNVR